MKKLCGIISTALTALLIVSCGTTAAPASAPVTASAPTAAPTPAPAVVPANTPSWAYDFPPSADVLWGIGQAKQSSPSLSMTTAEARARVDIARQLDSKVQAMFKNYQEDAGTAASQASASVQQDVSRQVANINLQGARPIKRWQAPDGTWWYLVEYKTSDARKEVAGILGNQQAAFAGQRMEKALQLLDVELAKPEKPMIFSGE